ncbi:MAG: AAA family ATPase [Candidatus Marinimicrobia bacterium]|nr:AAA family ATPase [Candidatus Neomarinimicrobiota bacterium]MCF7841019.1 AAA family ATPase [Candidatus Neomarinimicrobiota bacterium]
MNDPQGSIWRIWDLQVHTPFSALNNGFPADFDEYAAALLKRAAAMQIAAVGVTDYFSAKGYKKLREILDDDARLTTLCGTEVAKAVRRVLFIPNIELRTSTIVRSPDGNDSRVNFHVLFSDEVTPEQIEEDFLREVKFTAEGTPSGTDEEWPLTNRNLEILGHRLKTQHQPFAEKSDIEVGMMNAVVDHGKVNEILERKRSIFGNRYLLAVPADEDLSECSWDGQGHLARKIMIQKSHMLFSANAGTREFALGLRHPSVAEFIDEFKSLKPCIHSSDAHDEAHLFTPDERRFTWIKADPTFAGLKRILKEPDSRVFIGPEPPALDRQRNHTTRYCDVLTFQKESESILDEHWFSGDVPLNTGLVAVIGNKGSGKSALADSLGLVGNSPRESYFSFLHPNKFRRPRERKAEQFFASLHWLSGDVDTRKLSDPVDSTSVETIKYIPQNYLEAICNEVAGGEGSEFDKELKSVIFSHVPDHERLEFESFDELMAFRTNETHEHIALLKRKLRGLNERVITLNERLTDEHRESLEQQLRHKQAELAAHRKAMPEQIAPPDKDPAVEDQNSKLAAEIERIRAEVEKLDATLAETIVKNKQALRRKALAEKLKAKLDNLQRTYDEFAASCSECEDLGIQLKDVVTFEVRLAKLEEIITDALLESQDLSIKLLEDEDGTPAQAKKQHLSKVAELRRTMSAANQRYQQYLEDLAKWDARRKEIEGAPDTHESLAHLKAQIEELQKLPAELEEVKEDRAATFRAIYLKIDSLARMYASLYSPIEKAIAGDPLRDRGLEIGFRVSIVPNNFEERLFGLIQQGRRGTFCGAEEGQKKLRKMIREADFSTLQGVETFVAAMDGALAFDLRDGAKQPVRIGDLVKKGIEPVDVYDFVFGLDYLFPRYALTWGNMTLDQLSPGERGALLLVFYLLVDNDTIPLVIDQPEENLDNESVYRMLVPCIKKAKERRQVIIVTHNPNLAVVCDADQVIYCEMDKPSGNRITYTTGAIEHPVMNHHIVDVLEGTRPAFDVRDAKYKLIDS